VSGKTEYPTVAVSKIQSKGEAKMKRIIRVTLAIVFVLVMTFGLKVSTASAQVPGLKVGNGDDNSVLLQQTEQKQKAGIKGDISVTSPGQNNQNETRIFNYREESWSLNRGITITTKGEDNLDRPPQTYKFDPNPHNDPWYNKNQPKFYKEAATQIGQYFNKKGSFPRYGTASVTINGIPYKLNQR
jgi:hypothetical protein